MAKLKQWIALTVVASLAVLAAGWFLLISPKRATAAEVRTQTAATVAATDLAKTQLAVLQAQAKDLPKEQAKLDAASAKIPADLDMPNLLRSLSATASSTGVELVSVSPTALTPVAAAAAPAAPAPTSSATDSGATAAPKPTTATPATGGAGTLNAVNLSMNVVGSYFRVEQFLAALEDDPRAVRVSGLTLAPGGSAAPAAGSSPSAGGVPAAGGTPTVTGGASLTATITGQVFVAVGRTPLPAVVPPGSKPRATPSPGASPSASPGVGQPARATSPAVPAGPGVRAAAGGLRAPALTD